jgi:subtilase family serine protease
MEIGLHWKDSQVDLYLFKWRGVGLGRRFPSGIQTNLKEGSIMRKWASVSLLAALAFASASLTFAQTSGSSHGVIIVPDSTREFPSDIGVRAHTNHLIFSRPGTTGASPSGQTPQSLACVYATSSTNVSTGFTCNVNNTSLALPSGGTGIIAIVDAFDYPTAASDFQTFSKQFGLNYGNTCGPNHNLACFTTVFASGSKPHANNCWDLEAALDIEWSHAMAPRAQIVLVEAASNSFTNLLAAVDVATGIVQTGSTGKGEVSMSWGGSEFSSETGFDSHFNGSGGVVYFAASGDTGGVVIYPSASPSVVSAGGTSLILASRTGNFTGEQAWGSGGGGPSADEAEPSYQFVVTTVNLNGKRGTPDFSFDADPSTGVSIFDSSNPCQGFSGWVTVGGTSVASPSLAGIVNLAASFNASSQSELNLIYSTYNSTSYSSDFRDITSGSNGFPALLKWDFATGVGSDIGLKGK